MDLNTDLREGFETVACPGCGSAPSRPERKSQGFRIVQCVRCNLCYTNPRPGAQIIGRYYPQEYAPYQSDELGLAGKHAIQRAIVLQAYGSPELRPKGVGAALTRVASWFRPAHRLGGGVSWHGRGRLLDFGCGGGKFLRQMKACGWQVSGIDFSENAVRAVQESGIPAVQGSLPNPAIAPESFDVITMRHALEHVYDPAAVLRAAHDALDSEGRVFIEVPNYASWDVQYFADASIWLDLPRHLLHFTPPTLVSLVEQCGFRVLCVSIRSRSSSFAKAMRDPHHRPGRWDWLLKQSFGRRFIATVCGWRGLGNIIELLAEKKTSR